MEEKYDLLSIVLQRLSQEGVLENLILAGSWCQYFYRIVFDMSPEIPLVRTTDIDFLVPNPPRIKKAVNVEQILNTLGFDTDFQSHTGLVKFVHPDLEIQFLTPALGRMKSTPYEIKKLNINAEGLRYLTLLQDYKFQMEHSNIKIWLPEPEAYVLQKILISPKRKSQPKREKDLMAAKNIGELCLQYENHRVRMKSIFDDMPKKWQKRLLGVIEKVSPEMYLHLLDSDSQR